MQKFTTTSLLALALWLLAAASLQAQCPAGQSQLRLEIDPDYYWQEVSWKVVNTSTNSVIGSGDCAGEGLQIFNYCVPDSTCIDFQITDDYGDGITPDGYYRLLLNNEVIYENLSGAYGTGEHFSFNCPPGTACTAPLSIETGEHLTLDGGAQTWFEFTPELTGKYEISTCFADNTCPTKIWVYEDCPTLVSNNNLGTVFYADGGCTGGATATLYLAGGVTYRLRIGYSSGICDGTPIQFSLSYVGPITGCTDPLACNYQPLATVSDTCIYPGDPECPFAPDLLARGDVLRNSLVMSVVSNADGCAVDEGCFRGFNNRTILNFDTHIQNIGNEDYYIGAPPASINTPSDQFVWDACHNHWHYRGYAEYVLFDAQGLQVPIGSKNGFCVLDLECSGGGDGKYSCGNMGISAGCGDIYNAGLPCQWIDITDLPPGLYTFVMRVNWDKSPDKIGRLEATYDNNWAQACFNLTYGANGAPAVEFVDDCPEYTDCLGVQYGDARLDCEGVCNGPAILGDWNHDLTRTIDDVAGYLTAALTDTSAATACRDLHEDGHLNLFDAALLQECNLYQDDPQHWGARFPCQFPTGAYNPKDVVYFLPGAIDTVAHTFDIEMVNPYNKVLGYQIKINGLTINSVENLADDFQGEFLTHSNGQVIALSGTEQPVKKNILPSPVLRIHYGELTDLTVCLDSVIAVVNDHYQLSNGLLADPNCVVVATSGTYQPNADAFKVVALPNPSVGDISLFFSNPDGLPTSVTVSDLYGRPVQQTQSVFGETTTLERGQLPAGVYQFVVRNERGFATGRIVWQ